MAIAPKDVYPGQIDTGDANYPQGKAQNITVPGDGTGTPWEKRLVNDIFGFQQALLSTAGITPSGTPDNAITSQYRDALKYMIRNTPFTNGAFVSGGSGLSLDALPHLGTSVDVGRIQPMTPMIPDPSDTAMAKPGTDWFFKKDSFTWVQQTSGKYLYIPISNLIDHSLMLGVSIILNGAGGTGGAHTVMPTTGPAGVVQSQNLVTGTPTSLSSLATDNSPTLASYNAWHALDVPLNTPLLIDQTVSPKQLYLRLTGESKVSGFEPDKLSLIGVMAIFRVTTLAPGG